MTPRTNSLAALIACSFAAVLGSGCATAPPPKPLDVPGLEKSDNLVLSDGRPATETQAKTFSALITSEAYATYRIAESTARPTGLRLLQHRIYEKWPNRSGAQAITVHHLVVYLNMQAQLRKQSLGVALGGIIGGAVAARSSAPAGGISIAQIDSGALNDATRDEFRRALYIETENPAKLPVNVIYIDTTIEARRVATRCLVPPLRDHLAPTLAEVIDLCIGGHLQMYDAPAANGN